MVKKLIYSTFLILLAGCAGSPMHTAAIAETNRTNMLFLHEGMDQYKVVCCMGAPHCKECYIINQENYEIWFYVTQPITLGQTKLIQQNFTPLIFKNDILMGWGLQAYNHLVNVHTDSDKTKLEEQQKYTDDREEWPPNEHVIVPPPAKPEPSIKEEPIQTQPMENKVPQEIKEEQPQAQETKPSKEASEPQKIETKEMGSEKTEEAPMKPNDELKPPSCNIPSEADKSYNWWE